MSGENAPGPACELAGDIITGPDVKAAVVVLLFATDDGMLGIDVGAADVALPTACAAHGPALQAMLDGIMRDVRRRIDAFDAATPGMCRVDRRAPRGDA